MRFLLCNSACRSAVQDVPCGFVRRTPVWGAFTAKQEQQLRPWPRPRVLSWLRWQCINITCHDAHGPQRPDTLRAGTRYIFMGKLFERRPSYHLLGALLFLQLGISAAGWGLAKLQASVGGAPALGDGAAEGEADGRAARGRKSGPAVLLQVRPGPHVLFTNKKNIFLQVLCCRGAPLLCSALSGATLTIAQATLAGSTR
jgi:hypothetical protein